MRLESIKNPDKKLAEANKQVSILSAQEQTKDIKHRLNKWKHKQGLYSDAVKYQLEYGYVSEDKAKYFKKFCQVKIVPGYTPGNSVYMDYNGVSKKPMQGGGMSPK